MTGSINRDREASVITTSLTRASLETFPLTMKKTPSVPNSIKTRQHPTCFSHSLHFTFIYFSSIRKTFRGIITYWHTLTSTGNGFDRCGHVENKRPQNFRGGANSGGKVNTAGGWSIAVLKRVHLSLPSALSKGRKEQSDPHECLFRSAGH